MKKISPITAHRYLRILLIIAAMGGSCSSIPKTIYYDQGLQFSVTDDFKIGRVTRYEGNKSTYIPIYSTNNEVYAKFSIVWIPCRSDLDWEIQNYVDGLNSVYHSGNSKPVYSMVRDTSFASYDARQVKYTVPGERIGSYTVFHCDNVTVIIGQHSSIEAQGMIHKSRELIESTFSCSNVTTESWSKSRSKKERSQHRKSI